MRFVFITSLANAFYVRTLRTDLVWQDCEYGTASKVSAVPLHISHLQPTGILMDFSLGELAWAHTGEASPVTVSIIPC